MPQIRTRQLLGLTPAQNPVVYGSSLPSKFLNDLATGADSLDVVVLGDSNTGSSVSGMWGYQGGFSQAFNDRKYACYGLPIYPTMTGATLGTGGWRASNEIVAPTGNLLNGNISGSATAYSVWNPGQIATVTISVASPAVISYTAHGLTLSDPVFFSTSGTLPIGLTAGTTYWVASIIDANSFTVAATPQGTAVNTTVAGSGTHTIQTGTWVRYGSASGSPPAKDSWAYIESGAYSNNYNSIVVNSAHPLNSALLTLYHRVVYGTFTTGSGSFQGRARSYGGTIYATGLSQSTLGAAYSANVYEYTFIPAGVDMTAAWSGGAATGPCAILAHTVYRRVKGWSVTSHGYLAGYNSVGIQAVISTLGLTLLQEHLKELRTRQRTAGGSGRVLLVVHSGINGSTNEPETASRWTSCHLAVWNKYKAAWSALGYPPSDLAIVSFVGAPKNADDSSNNGSPENLIPVRAAANAMALANPDMTVVDIKKLMNYEQLVYVPTTNAGVALAGAANFYQAGSSNVHLSGGTGGTTDGYTVVSNMVISALLAKTE